MQSAAVQTFHRVLYANLLLCFGVLCPVTAAFLLHDKHFYNLTSSESWVSQRFLSFHRLTADHTHDACMIQTSKHCLYLCCVILLRSNKHMKCLSWTRVELPWIMIAISQSTICAFRTGTERVRLQWRKQQHLCLPSDHNRTSWWFTYHDRHNPTSVDVLFVRVRC